MSANKQHTDSERETMNSLNNHETFTIGESISNSGFGCYQYKLMFFCGYVWAADALEIMLLTFLMPEVKKSWDLQHNEDGLLGSAVFIGMIIGAATWGHFSDVYGRKFGYIGSISTAFCFGLLSSISWNIGWLIFFRFAVGVGLGGAFVSYSLFTEFVPKEVRAKALTMEQFFWVLGALSGVGIAWALIPTVGWRWFLFCSALPLTLSFIFYFLIPESPRFLLIKGKTNEAHKILKDVASTNKKPMLKGNLKSVEVIQSSVFQLLRPPLLSTTLLLWPIWFAITFGYYGISFITPRLLSKSENTYMIVFLTTIAEIPGFILPGFFIDAFGRRRTLSLAFLIYSISVFCLAIPYLPNVAAIIFVFIGRLFISGLFSVAYIYTSEVYPTVVRASGTGLCLIMSRFAAIITTFIAEDIGTSTAVIIYGFIALVAAFLSFSLPLSTSGIDLKDQLTDIHETDKVKNVFKKVPVEKSDENFLLSVEARD